MRRNIRDTLVRKSSTNSNEWEKKRLCTIEFQNYSHRCTQAICDFADQFYPELPRTISMNKNVTDHDGVFVVPTSRVQEYFNCFHPQVLRYSRATDNVLGTPINFGEAKGMEFERVLIYPHKMLEKFLATGIIKDAGADIGKIYVAITRARQSTAFVVPDDTSPTLFPIIEVWKGAKARSGNITPEKVGMATGIS